MASNEETEGFLVHFASSNGGGFPQQGTVDWSLLTKATIKASVGVLARLSGAGVDSYTVVVAQAIAAQFRLSKLGLHRLDSALRNLRSASAMGEALWFGFGVQHLVRTLAQTMEGMKWIMLAASLSEIHSTELSARIILAFVELATEGRAGHLTPSLRQWHALIKSCAGVLATTSFPVVTEHMMSLASDSDDDSPGASARFAQIGGDPYDIARAIKALAAVSNGSLEAITLTGGPECGWIAALAHWFFDLDVEIRSQSGRVLMPSAKRVYQPQVLVIYTNAGPETLQVIGRVYAIRTFTPSRTNNEEMFAGVISGRVPWKTCLQDTFGSRNLQALLKHSKIFGKAVGSAARIFKAVVFVEPLASLTRLFLMSWFGYCDFSYGHGFVSHIITQFPELARIREHAEQACNETADHAVSEYEVAKAQLSAICGCKSCNEARHDDTLRDKGDVCLAALCETLIRLGWKTVMCNIDPVLMPTRSGLMNQYFQTLNQFVTQSDDEGNPSNEIMLGSLLERLEFEDCAYAVITLFTGSTGSHMEHPAVVVRGLCFYIDPLRDVSDDPAIAFRIHAISGGIQTASGQNFDEITEVSPSQRTPVNTAPSPQIATIQGLPPGKGSCGKSFDVKLVLEESMDRLFAHITITIDNQWAIVTPLTLLKLMIGATGLIDCKRQGCTELPKTFQVAATTGEGQLTWKAVRDAGHDVVLRQVNGHPIARCVALLCDETGFARSFATNLRPETSVMLLQREECLSCSLRTATGLVQREDIVFVVQS